MRYHAMLLSVCLRVDDEEAGKEALLVILPLVAWVVLAVN